MTKNRMRAVRYHDFGGPSVISIDNIEPLNPRPEEIAIDVRGIGVNPSDILRREGAFGHELPFIPGKDVSGIVRQAGEDVEQFEQGDRVFGYIPHSNVPGSGNDRQGTYAEQVVAPSHRFARLPPHVSFEAGAAIPAVGVTAWEALVNYGGLAPGETCLIHGGSGGVGHIAVQLANVMGADVVATAGAKEKRKRVRDLGADAVINYEHPHLAEAIVDVCPQSPAVILDHRVQDYLELDVDLVARQGTIAVIGGAKDGATIENVSNALLKNISIVPFTVSLTTDIGMILERIASLLKDKQINPIIAKSFDLGEAPEAQWTVSNESFVGKVVMTL